MRNRANLFKYCLESISRQTYEGPLEVCIADGNSTDNLMNLIDRYSDAITFKYAVSDRKKAPIAISSNMPCADINTAIKNMATYDYIIKTDPEIVLKDEWIIEEITEELARDNTRMYNARTHFTEGDTWYMSFDDIIGSHEKYYHYAEGGPFSRSKFYFCCGFDKNKFIELGGIEEMFCYGTGYDDTCFREHWKNRYGQYEKEITGQAIHLWHGHNTSPPSWEELNRRTYNMLKYLKVANQTRLVNNKLVSVPGGANWGVPEMLSKVYTIKDGQIINVESPCETSQDLDLPF